MIISRVAAAVTVIWTLIKYFHHECLFSMRKACTYYAGIILRITSTFKTIKNFQLE